jgi:hypothetical protein
MFFAEDDSELWDKKSNKEASNDKKDMLLCNKTGHVRSKCHSIKQARYSYFLFLCEIL